MLFAETEIQRLAAVKPEEREVAELLRLWSECERQLEHDRDQVTADLAADAQVEIMNVAAQTPARDFRDVLAKLTIWRWNRFGDDEANSDMEGGEAVAISAIDDLQRLTGEELKRRPRN
ncbi:MAG: hypothetical protein AAFX08_04435 [Pseudomonadota bacterium]